MMKVELRVFATLRQFAPQIPLEGTIVEVEPGNTLRDLMHELKLPEEHVKIVMRNNLQADLDDVLQDGDRVAYIPAVAGG
jgi:sulfur-carrier protein